MRRIVDPSWSVHSGQPIARQRTRARRRTAFTLLELLVAIAILVLMAALVAPNVVNQMRETRVAQAAESIRDIISRSRTLALDAGIDYQFRYEPNGRKFVVLPMELEPTASNSTIGDSATSGKQQ